MSAKTTYKATSEYTGETVTRTSARDYGYALDVRTPRVPEYTLPAGRFWITTGHKLHDYNRETGTRGYWQEHKEAAVCGGHSPAAGIRSFHSTREAAEKAGRAVQAEYRKIAEYAMENYGVEVQIAPVIFRVVPTTV